MGNLDYLELLYALSQIPFPIGKKLLARFVMGDEKDKTIRKHKFHSLSGFGSLSGYNDSEVFEMLDRLILNQLIEEKSLPTNRYWKVLELSSKGWKEIDEPTLHKKNVGNNYMYDVAQITAEDEKIFLAFDFFLSKYNKFQKKAITSSNKNILCVAGAGSGKTTTLTKRIEFLTTFRSVAEKKILAITFTRKARKEMQNRLEKVGIKNVRVETFNSFCEKILQRYNDLVYDKKVDVLSYRDKIRLFQQALTLSKTTIDHALRLYYSSAQMRIKTMDELSFSFMNDCFSVLEYYKNEGKKLVDFSSFPGLSVKEKSSAKLVFEICTTLHRLMETSGLRDYTDQLIHTINFFEKNEGYIPRFEHVLVDEYQDINSSQMKLIKLLSPPNLFCVGDPRQAIFGWRGANVSFILDFQKYFPESEVITLLKNYRSAHSIVNLMNASISKLLLPPLESCSDLKGGITYVSCASDVEEYTFVTEQILKSNTPKNEIFVLGRTHRILKELGNHMNMRGIPYIIKSDDTKKEVALRKNCVTLATVHAIKGMEADTVFVVGCNSQNFPCKASDHPVIDLIKDTHYDKEEEERRLFYVALSRAKRLLYVSHTGSATRFITPDVKKYFQTNINRKISLKTQNKGDLFERLKEWRLNVARKMNVPAYVVFQDSVLLELSIRKPQTLNELEEVRGIGPTKLMKYGEELLEVL